MKDNLYQEIIGHISLDNMNELLEEFSTLHRLTGTQDCEKAADFIFNKLESNGVDCKLHHFEGYFSDPVKSRLTIVDSKGTILDIPSRPRSFSLNCPEGVTGDIVFDSKSEGSALNKIEEQNWYSQFRGKVVLSWNFYEDYVKKIEAYGAIGLIHIWPTEEKVIHEETVGPVWGTPTPESSSWIPRIPVLGITRENGVKLLEIIRDNSSSCIIRSWVENRVAGVSLPVAFIPGKTEEYVLVSGHYDSWYEGVTDNAVGNAVCLEMANVFSRIKGRLERGIKIAFWPGHSNGRYMGSAWYCDNFWRELKENCIAHLNIDSPGSQGGLVVLPRTTQLEGTSFLSDLVREFTGLQPNALLDIPRGADQSFWGVGIPFHVMYKYEPVKENKIYSCPGSGGGWWWHSEFDSMDKVDTKILLRDIRLNLATAYHFASVRRLPADFDNYFDRQKGVLEDLSKNTDDEFNFGPIFEALSSLKEKVENIMKNTQDDKKINLVIKLVGGGLNKLIYSSCSEYEFDNAFPAKLFPGLHHVYKVYKHNTPKDQFLFTLTGFVRQRNRMVNELYKIERELDYILISLHEIGTS